MQVPSGNFFLFLFFIIILYIVYVIGVDFVWVLIVECIRRKEDWELKE
jgi:hypothetical protein